MYLRVQLSVTGMGGMLAHSRPGWGWLLPGMGCGVCILNPKKPFKEAHWR